MCWVQEVGRGLRGPGLREKDGPEETAIVKGGRCGSI